MNATANIIIRDETGQPKRAITLNSRRLRASVALSGGMTATVTSRDGSVVLDDGMIEVVLDDETGSVALTECDPFAGLDR
jgi:hypothetical protein